MPDEAAKLTCPQCGHENAPERVFCKECGVRLRTIDNPAVRRAAAEEDRRQRQFSAGLPVGAAIAWLVKTAFTAAIVAALIQLLRPPAFVDRSEPMDEQAAAAAEAKLTGAASQGTRIDASQGDVNRYLAARVPSAPLGTPGMLQGRLSRVYVELGRGSLWVTGAREMYGYRIYPAVEVAPVHRGGATSLDLRGGRVGRLPLPIVAARHLLPSFETLTTPLGTELELLKRSTGFVISPGNAVVLFNRARP